MQPFILFEQKYLARLLNMRRYYFVIQVYSRMVNDAEKKQQKPLLLSDYDNPGFAETHYNVVRGTSYSHLLNLTIEKDLSVFMQLLNTQSFQIYWNMILDPKAIKREFDRTFKDRLRRFVINEYHWDVGKVEDVEAKGFIVKCGELTLNLRYLNEHRQVKFEVIENYRKTIAR